MAPHSAPRCSVESRGPWISAAFVVLDPLRDKGGLVERERGGRRERELVRHCMSTNCHINSYYTGRVIRSSAERCEESNYYLIT